MSCYNALFSGTCSRAQDLEKTTQQDLLLLENEECGVDPCVLRIGGFTA